jgi:hypothetical protein
MVFVIQRLYIYMSYPEVILTGDKGGPFSQSFGDPAMFLCWEVDGSDSSKKLVFIS